MSDCIRLVQNEKCEFEIYDDTYDITIHCRIEEEQKKAEKLLDAANCDMYWRKTTEEPPKKEDADEFWNVFGWYAASTMIWSYHPPYTKLLSGSCFSHSRPNG